MTELTVVRPARYSDYDAINTVRATTGWATDYYTSRALSEMDAGRRIVFVADQHGFVIGQVQLQFASEDPETANGVDVAHLSDLVVLPAYQQRGIGRRLALRVEQTAFERGFQMLTLDVELAHTDTQRLYEHWGYTYFRQTISPWGTWLNGMRKPLLVEAPSTRRHNVLLPPRRIW